MSEQNIGAGEKPTGFNQEQFWKGMESGAKSELFTRITGETKVYDPNDPSVEQRMGRIADEAIRNGHYTDTEGVQHKLGIGGFDKRTVLELATAHIKRFIDEEKK